MNSAFNQNSNGVSAVGMASPVYVGEPPLSPPSPRASAAQAPASPPPPERPTLEVAPAPTPAPVAVPPASLPAAPAAPAELDVPAGLPLEGLLLRFGLITTEQLTEAMREKSATGKDIGAIVLERGWVDEAQLARVSSYGPAFVPDPAVDPAPAPEPEPAAEPQPEPPPVPVAEVPTPTPALAPEPELAPPAAVQQPTGQRIKVFARLANGDRVDAGSFDGLNEAKERAAEIARTLAADAPEWPFVAGRFLRPDTIVSLDVEPELVP